MSNYDIRSLSSVKHLRACCLVFLGALYSLQVSAQSANAGDVFSWLYYQNSGNTTSVNTGGTSANAVRDMGWGPTSASGNNVGWKGSSAIRNPSGNPLVVDVVAKTPGAKAAKLLTAGAKALPLLGTGIAIWEVCKELNFGCEKSPDGSVSVTQSASGTYDPAQKGAGAAALPYCSTYSGLDFGQSCRAFTGSSGMVYSYLSGQVVTDLLNSGCQWLNNNSPWHHVGCYVTATSSPVVPATLQDLENAIAAKSGWPQSSKIHDALKESAIATGQQIPLESPTVSGPATSKGTTSTKSDPAAGTTTTTTTTHNHTYNDNRVTSTVTTSVNVTNNNTGQGTTTTTTEEPVNEQSECEKNPSSLNCADLDTPTGDIPKTEKRITYEAENLGFAGGSCPADVIRTIGGQQMMLVNWSQNCNYITSYAKPMILAAATFAALMIIFVGGKLE